MNETIPEKEEDRVVKYNKARLNVMKAYELLKPLQDEVNAENLILRNTLCRCGSKKKWKKCCLKIHEQKTLMLEHVVAEFNKTQDNLEKMRQELKL